jgi:hypothetical protein
MLLSAAMSAKPDRELRIGSIWLDMPADVWDAANERNFAAASESVLATIRQFALDP